MRRIQKNVVVDIVEFKELSNREKTLIQRACQVRLNAQAPYSNYWVGCSLVASGGSFSFGCNVENVHYEVVHAEENAICAAVAKLGPFRIEAMAIVGAPAGQNVIWPPPENNNDFSPIASVGNVCPSCGHCLQKIAENCFNENGTFNPDVVLIGYRSRTGEIYRTTIGDAYPMPFLPQHLGINYSKDPRLNKKIVN